MDRVHLLAASFGGFSGRQNRVPVWKAANQGSGTYPMQMRAVENQIQAALDAGQRVYYFAQPIYGAGGNLYMPTDIAITWATAAGGLKVRYIPNVP
jgi:hypothetical protein